jgi:hypothetical protein
VIIIWLGLLASFGIYNLVNYDAGVFMAFNPGEAFGYLTRHGEEGWRSLGGQLQRLVRSCHDDTHYMLRYHHQRQRGIF